MKNASSRVALRALSLKLMVVAGTFCASSAYAATANIPASATIVVPITLTEPAPIRLGNILPGAAAGTIVLTLAATIPATGPTTAAPISTTPRVATGATAIGGDCSATVLCGLGSVLITGAPNATFATVTVPATVSLTGTGPAMVLTTTRRYGALGVAGATTGAGTLSATGTAYLIIGGSLAVGTAALQTAGAYTGTAAITIDY